MAKMGKRARWRESNDPLPDIDAFLCRDGLSVSDYRLSSDGVVSFKDKTGREFDLLIDDDRLFSAVKERLDALGLREAL